MSDSTPHSGRHGTKRVWIDGRFIGVRVGSRYFKLRDIRQHPLRFTERNGYGYWSFCRIGSWEFGVRT
jgi:hypothetical protein